MHKMIAAAALLFAAAASAEMKIADYSLTWNAGRAGDVVFAVKKTPESTKLQLEKKGDFSGNLLSLSAKDATALAPVLAGTQAVFDKQKSAGGDPHESKVAGSLAILFATGNSGFFVHVSRNQGLTGIMLTRQEALDLAPLLAKAEEYVKFIDAKVAF